MKGPKDRGLTELLSCGRETCWAGVTVLTRPTTPIHTWIAPWRRNWAYIQLCAISSSHTLLNSCHILAASLPQSGTASATPTGRGKLHGPQPHPRERDRLGKGDVEIFKRPLFLEVSSSPLLKVLASLLVSPKKRSLYRFKTCHVRLKTPTQVCMCLWISFLLALSLPLWRVPQTSPWVVESRLPRHLGCHYKRGSRFAALPPTQLLPCSRDFCGSFGWREPGKGRARWTA